MRVAYNHCVCARVEFDNNHAKSSCRNRRRNICKVFVQCVYTNETAVCRHRCASESSHSWATGTCPLRISEMDTRVSEAEEAPRHAARTPSRTSRPGRCSWFVFEKCFLLHNQNRTLHQLTGLANIGQVSSGHLPGYSKMSNQVVQTMSESKRKICAAKVPISDVKESDFYRDSDGFYRTNMKLTDHRMMMYNQKNAERHRAWDWHAVGDRVKPIPEALLNPNWRLSDQEYIVDKIAQEGCVEHVHCRGLTNGDYTQSLQANLFTKIPDSA